MKKFMPFAIALLLIFTAAAQDKKPEVKPAAATASNAAFEKIKTLAGDWTATDEKGEKAKGITRYEVVSAGSAVLITMPDEHEGQMITVIHPDGSNSIIATHYCSAKNQPRMVATSFPDPNRIVFNFKDVTNYNPATDPGHMVGVAFEMKDADHHTQVWKWKGTDGKEGTATFFFTRKK